MARAQLAGGGLWLPVAAHAIGTAAGTEIRKQAEIPFVLNGSVETHLSRQRCGRLLTPTDVAYTTGKQRSGARRRRGQKRRRELVMVLGDLAPAAGSQDVQFAVTID